MNALPNASLPMTASTLRTAKAGVLARRQTIGPKRVFAFSPCWRRSSLSVLLLAAAASSLLCLSYVCLSPHPLAGDAVQPIFLRLTR